MKVTKEMMIADVVEKYPDSAIVFLEHGLHCIGCSASPFESVESGMMGHGRSEEDLNALDLKKIQMKKLKRAIANIE